MQLYATDSPTHSLFVFFFFFSLSLLQVYISGNQEQVEKAKVLVDEVVNMNTMVQRVKENMQSVQKPNQCGTCSDTTVVVRLAVVVPPLRFRGGHHALARPLRLYPSHRIRLGN